MGTYINPGNQAFAEIAGASYVDKTGLLRLINQVISRENKLICVSRPRRFGKSWTAKMMTAYYDCSCDSHNLFDHRNIARTTDYLSFLNRFNVISLDISGFISGIKAVNGSLMELTGIIQRALWKDLIAEGFQPEPDDTLNDFLLRCIDQSHGRPFIFIIDEWDMVIREAQGDEAAKEAYMNLLRGWFKNSNFTPKAVAAAYMTGILPIQKNGSQSAISDFQEFSILNPGPFAKYTGFTESEVKRVCRKNRMPFNEVSFWYDGYELPGTATIYNPYSVMCAVKAKACRSFWGKTSAAEGLTNYVKIDFDGLQETIASFIAGSEISVNTDGFQNDLESFRSKDDVVTLLIHLGYLTFNAEHNTAHIPNEEVRREFRNFLAAEDTGKHWIRLMKRADHVLDNTIAGNSEEVAKTLSEIREEQYAPQYYNNEQSLRAIIKYAYLSAIGKYIKVEEMPSGKGIADVVFIPASGSRLPALVVELKWNRTAGGALSQIKSRKYTAALKPFAGNIILCGINYDAESGKHTCLIERA
ncbi:MAG: AAA family ATPase [Lachnospiraceae bacterium]|nr:AAA family ATPase [Lachnospiraceae bacterium]